MDWVGVEKAMWGPKFPKPHTHKYSVQPKKTIVNGIELPSKLHAAVYELLLWREKVGEIRNIKLEVPVDMWDHCQHCGEPTKRHRWKVDFSCELTKDGSTLFVEAKGLESAKYKRDLKRFKKNPPGKLEVWKGNWRKPRLVETIG